MKNIAKCMESLIAVFLRLEWMGVFNTFYMKKVKKSEENQN